MITEKLANYLSTIGGESRAMLQDVAHKVESLGACDSPQAQEMLSIAADEISADAVTVSCMLPYAFLSRQQLQQMLDSGALGGEISGILSGILKIPEINTEKLKTQNENHIKLLVTLSGDVRAIILLLAEHLQKIRHIKDLSDPDSVRVATLVQYLYSPIAHRIGLYKVKTEMEEICLKFFEYDTYRSIADKLQIRKVERDRYIKEFIEPLKKRFEQLSLNVRIKGRPKSISSIYSKMKKQQVDVDGIYDLFAIRVIIDSKPEDEKSDCWKVYSIITEKYKPNPYRLRDWISVPKASGYESLHTTLIGPEGRWVEVQIRTTRMDEIAEKGLAAHWKYKNGTDGQDSGSIFARIREAIESPSQERSVSAEKKALYTDEIYIFTPDGDLRKLHYGDTVLDFAFSIHSEVGSHCTGAHVNGKFVSFKHVLSNGDTVKVLTANNQKPAEDWMKIAHSSRTKTRIRRILDVQNNRMAVIGRDIIRQKLSQAGIQFSDASVLRMIKYFGADSAVSLYQQFGDGTIDPCKAKMPFACDPQEAAAQAAAPDDRKYREAATDTSTDYLTISDMDTMGYTFAKCCNPLPGDRIFAFITASSGTKVHRYDCPNAANILSRFPYRVVRAVWNADASREVSTAVIKLHGIYDMTMHSVISSVITDEFHVHMRSFSIAEEPGGKFTAMLSLNLMGDSQLQAIKERFKRVKNIEKVI